MSGRHPFNELTKDFPPERQRRIDDMKRELLARCPCTSCAGQGP